MPLSLDNAKELLERKNAFDGNLAYGAKRFHEATSRSGKGRPASGAMVATHATVVRDSGLERYRRVEEFWEDVESCPVCGSNNKLFFLHRLGLDIYRCQACSHRFQNPRIRFEKICDLYATDESPVKVYNSPTQKALDEIKYSYGLDLVDALSPPNHDRTIDIGCGAGGFLFTAEKHGWRSCVGVDINEKWGPNFSGTGGVEFINSTFEDISKDRVGGNYGLVTMWNVLEHIYDLHATVEAIKGIMANGGLLLIMVPNVESLASRIIREMSPTFNWKHVSHFCQDSLGNLMHRHRLTCEHIETVISEIDNIKSYLSGEYPYYGFGDPDNLFPFITPEYIHGNMLGSRLLGVYRKM